MSYSISDTKTKALIYNTIEQKLENTDIADQYIKIVSFNKAEESHYNATIDLLMTEGDKVTKASIKVSNNYVEFFDCSSTYDIILNVTAETNKDTYYVKFVNKSNTRSSITLNTQVRKGIMTLDTIGIGSGINSNNDILTINAGYARALPDNYLTSVSGLTVKIENNNLIIS